MGRLLRGTISSPPSFPPPLPHRGATCRFFSTGVALYRGEEVKSPLFYLFSIPIHPPP